MFKWLSLIGVVLLVLAGAGLIAGLTAQQPFAFGLALFCGFPASMFFLGGATFSFAANYSITPKTAAAETPRVNGKIRFPRPQEIG